MKISVKRIYTDNIEVEIINQQVFEQVFWAEIQVGISTEQILKKAALQHSSIRTQHPDCIKVTITEKSELIEC